MVKKGNDQSIQKRVIDILELKDDKVNNKNKWGTKNLNHFL